MNQPTRTDEIIVGDVCEIIADFGGDNAWTIGLECTVVGAFAMQRGVFNTREGIRDRLGWRISIAGYDHLAQWVARLGEIRKKAPPADELSSTDEWERAL